MIKILFLAPSPSDRPTNQFDDELRLIESISERNGGSFDLRARWSVSIDDLAREIRRARPDIVHLVSSGGGDDFVVLSDAQGAPTNVAVEDLAAVFAGLDESERPRCLVLNYCYNVAQATRLAADVDVVVAMTGLLWDDAALAFSAAFYAALADGRDVAGAVEDGRAEAENARIGQGAMPHLEARRTDPRQVRWTPAATRGPVSFESTPVDQKPIRLFCSYSHRDEPFSEDLEKNLAILKRKGLIFLWKDRQIRPGDDWAGAINANLENSDLILLLVSADFINSDYCYEKEMKRAIELHKQGKSVVVPIILKPCLWEDADFGFIQALPKDAKPITSWPDPNEAWTFVARGIKQLVDQLMPKAG